MNKNTTKEVETTKKESDNFLGTKNVNLKQKGNVVSVGTNSNSDFVIMKLDNGKYIGMFVDQNMKITWDENLDQKICKTLFQGEYAYTGLGQTKLVEVTLTKEITLKKEFEEVLGYDDKVEQWYWADSAYVLQFQQIE